MPALPVSSVLMTVEDYLAAEERAELKHEYLAGMPYAMAGTSTDHNALVFTLSGILHSRLMGSGCVGFASDMKVKVQWAGDTYFYYPDALIVCGKAGVGPSWCEAPRVIFEVISESTRKIDEREKWMVYKMIPSLDAYVRIEQEQRLVAVDRRQRPAGSAKY
jgi:Uma2 family endonuclease